MSGGAADPQPHLPPIERVVVLADPDDPHPASLRWAAALACTLEIHSLLLAPDVVDSAEKVPGERAEEIARTVAVVRAWLSDVGVDVDEIGVTTEDPAGSLEDILTPGDIAIVGANAVVGLTSYALGAVHHGLARSIACPLVVVPPLASPALSPGPVIVGLVGGRAGSMSATWARRIATALGRDVVGVHAISPDDGEPSAPTTRTADDMSDLVIEERRGRPEDVLREAAEQLDASLVVVTVKRERTLGGRLVGVVADALLHEPPAPLAILTHDYIDADSTEPRVVGGRRG